MNTRAWNLNLSVPQQVDRGLIYGFAISAVLITLGVVLSGRVLSFFDPASFLMVLGGTVGATMVQFSLSDLERAVIAAKQVLFVPSMRPIDRMRELLRISQRVKQEGLLSLENESGRIRDRFLKSGLEIAVDGQPEQDIKRILETEIITSHDQHSRAVQVFQALGIYAPALGLIGTLIGLIQLLGDLNNPASIGPAMSLALITTLYGACLANIVFLPIAGKLKARTEEALMVKAMTVEGILSISRQESPIILEQRLQRFFPSAVG